MKSYKEILETVDSKKAYLDAKERCDVLLFDIEKLISLALQIDPWQKRFPLSDEIQDVLKHLPSITKELLEEELELAGFALTREAYSSKWVIEVINDGE